jgi:alpha-tubulin suppressor-like RCC1 family protein
MSHVIAIAPGGYHSLALKDDGTVWASGWNLHGSLGMGDSTVRYSFAQGPVLTNVVSVAAGEYHSLALRSDGTVWAAGSNAYGQLGLGADTSDRVNYLSVPALSDVAAIACGYNHSLALKRDGTVWAAGFNANGQLGTGDTVNRSGFRQVPGLANVAAIAGGAMHSLALTNGGTLWVAGGNTYS